MQPKLTLKIFKYLNKLLPNVSGEVSVGQVSGGQVFGIQESGDRENSIYFDTGSLY